MLVTFLERAALSRTGPMYMVGEHADLPEDIAHEFITLGVVEAERPPAPSSEPVPPPEAPDRGNPSIPTVDRPEKDRMIKKGDTVRK